MLLFLGFWHFETNIPYQNNFVTPVANVTPLICYESIFGATTARAVNKGSELLLLMLNEGWHKSLVGASQFMYYSSLRAIENRRDVVRSSNYGYSGCINQKGEIVSSFSERTATALTYTVKLNTSKTFYMQYGDWIGKLAGWCLVGLFLYICYRLLFSQS